VRPSETSSTGNDCAIGFGVDTSGLISNCFQNWRCRSQSTLSSSRRFFETTALGTVNSSMIFNDSGSPSDLAAFFNNRTCAAGHLLGKQRIRNIPPSVYRFSIMKTTTVGVISYFSARTFLQNINP
jgi:hypothetical protein